MDQAEIVTGPILRILSAEESLLHLAARLAAEYDVAVSEEWGEGPWLIDPAVGVDRIRSTLAPAPIPPTAAVIRRPSCASALFLALRLSKARFVADPRTNPEHLRSFLVDAFAVAREPDERRTYPRAGSSGVTLLAPADAELIDLSPYGARIRLPGEHAGAPVLRLRLRLLRPGIEDDVDCHVAGMTPSQGQTELRLRFVKVRPEVQQELLRIAKSHILCGTIWETFRRCEQGEIEGYRCITSSPELVEMLRRFVADWARLTFSRMHGGRVVSGIAASLDEDQRQFRVGVEDPQALGPIGSYLCYTTSVRHESYLMDGYVLGHEPGAIVLTQPARCALTDQRAQQRLSLGLDSPLSVDLGGLSCPVTDLSPRGISFYVPPGAEKLPEAGKVEVGFSLSDGSLHRETILVLHRRAEASGHTVGATFLDRSTSTVPEDLRPPLVEEEFTGQGVVVGAAERAYHAERVRFSAGDRYLAGLWNEVSHPTPATVVIVPPAWGKTKESTSLLAQFLCATFDANRRRVAILRIDYANAMGESSKEPQFRQAGKETLGIRATTCVEDIQAAITYAHSRLATPPCSTILIGMSFSGPLCLRATVKDERVTELVELMGASDIQDLIRTSSGGIDYVSNYRAGIRYPLQNILGMLSDVNCWCADGLAGHLLFFQDAQADAARLCVPLLWIHGRYDAFVNQARIRGILEAATQVERRLVVVPCGHVPTKSSEAIVSYIPIARFLLERASVPHPLLVAPTEQQSGHVSDEEWKQAPRVQLASPRVYWRGYMMGEGNRSLGFDVLAMTREYHELMDLQIRLLDPRPGETIHDLGAGMGHSLSYLSKSPSFPEFRVFLYDLVPQLLEEARRRANGFGGRLETIEWDAQDANIPESMRGAPAVLMSLFLSCLSDAPGFLRRLADMLPFGARIVASSIRPDADLSAVYTALLDDIFTGRRSPPPGHTQESFLQAVRDYMNSAAWLLRLTDEGTFHLFSEEEFHRVFEDAGFRVRTIERSCGVPQRAIVLAAEKS